MRARLLLVLGLVGVGLLGALLGILVAGTVTRDVGPFQAELSFAPSLHGGTQVAVPPLGRLDLDTHSGPVLFKVGVTQLRPEAARSIAKDPQQLGGIGARVESDLRAGLRNLVLRTVLVTVLGAAALGFLVFRRPVRALTAAGAGLAALTVVGAGAALTVNQRALTEPRFTGILASAPAAVGDVRGILGNLDAYGGQLGLLVTNVTKLYDVTSRLPAFAPNDDTLRVLHVSDLHLSPTAYDVIGSVVRQYRIDVVVDSGDSTDHGSPPETRYLDAIAGLGVPYVWVRGNHDSRLVQSAIARLPNVTVLDGPEVVTVAGLRFLGQGDPRFTPDKTTRDDDAPPAVLELVGEQLLAAARDAEPPPDIVVTHDPATTGPLLGQVPLVLAGHAHERRTTTTDGTTLLVQGSTGGAGLRALEGEEPTPVTLSVLYLDPGTRTLQAYDDITLGGLGSSDARISRNVVAPVVTASPNPSTPPSSR